MTILFTNNASTSLASGITSGATSLTVVTGQGALFPTITGSNIFYLTLQNQAGTTPIEIVKVTARSGDTMTIVRGQDNTTASAFNAGDKVELRLPAVVLQDFPQLDVSNTFTVDQSVTGTLTATNSAYTGTLTGGTGVVNLGSGQFYKDARGNVGIGTSSPTGKFEVYGANGSGVTTVNVTGGASAGDYGILGIRNGTTTRGRLVGDASVDALRIDTAGGASTVVTFLTGSSYTERMRIDSSGNLLVGGTTALLSSKITNYGRYWCGSGNSSGDAEYILSNYASATAAWTMSVRQDVGGANNDLKFLRLNSSGSYQGIAMQIAQANGIVSMPAYGAGAATFSASGVISSVSDETWKIKDGVPTNPDAMLQKLEAGYWFYNEEKAPIFGKE